MIRNLVHNAEEHAGQRIDVSVTIDEQSVQIAVSDDGPGIPLDQRRRVFERFVRLDSARTRDGDAGHRPRPGDRERRRLEPHGTIAISDGPLGGACFDVEIPALGNEPQRRYD